MNVTIKQLARKAILSVATVSRVGRTKGQVSKKNRRRVLKAAERLCYVPNIAVRSLITSHKNTIGVRLPDLQDEFFSEVSHGRELVLRHQVLPTPIVIRKSSGASLKKTNKFSKLRASPCAERFVQKNRINDP